MGVKEFPIINSFFFFFVGFRSESSILEECNSSSPLLADIVRFVRYISLQIQNASSRERFPRSCKECFVLLSNQYGISQHLYQGEVSMSL